MNVMKSDKIVKCYVPILSEGQRRALRRVNQRKRLELRGRKKRTKKVVRFEHPQPWNENFTSPNDATSTVKSISKQYIGFDKHGKPIEKKKSIQEIVEESKIISRIDRQCKKDELAKEKEILDMSHTCRRKVQKEVGCQKRSLHEKTSKSCNYQEKFVVESGITSKNVNEMQRVNEVNPSKTKVTPTLRSIQLTDRGNGYSCKTYEVSNSSPCRETISRALSPINAYIVANVLAIYHEHEQVETINSRKELDNISLVDSPTHDGMMSCKQKPLKLELSEDLKNVLITKVDNIHKHQNLIKQVER